MPKYFLNYHSLDDEKRYLKTHNLQLKRSLEKRIKNQEDLEEELRKVKREKASNEVKLNSEIEKLKAENEKLRKQRDMYKKMLFKENAKKQDLCGKDLKSKLDRFAPVEKVQRGGSSGHQGYSRKLPQRVPDKIFRVFFNHCPHCHHPLKRTFSIDTHTVEDIQSPTLTPIQVIRYEKERQWCSFCQKEVVATSPEEIPGVRFGINLIIYIMLLKYGAKVSLDSILLLLQQSYDLNISKGEVINLLLKARLWLGTAYDQIKDEIRASPIKHADETSWRVLGINSWIWGFMTKQHIYLTVEQSRGKGIPEEVLANSDHQDILIRDDYAGYSKLPLKHQSCRAHLLRKSHEASTDVNASEEVKQLHQTLKGLFNLLDETVKRSFDLNERENFYQSSWRKLSQIISCHYLSQDAKDIQTRIKKQGKNLLTALLVDGVPLTNNLAERALRKVVVLRKVSGGSRSWGGVKTTSVNMSIIQTIQAQDLPLIPTLKEYLLNGIHQPLGNPE